MNDSPLTILFEDYHCLAVAKAAPLLTQAPPGIPSLEALVREHVKVRYNKPGNVYLGIPHRLDRPVSGVVVFARNTKAARRLAEQFQTHRVTKTYWAVVEGTIKPPDGTWVDHIHKIASEARSEVVAADAPGAKEATLDYRVLHLLPDDRTLIELRPRTGRMHQLRLQSASRGHPVIGDVLYGSIHEFGPTAELSRDRIIALHARSLRFYHPTSLRENEVILVTSPLPDSWANLGIPPDLIAAPLADCGKMPMNSSESVDVRIDEETSPIVSLDSTGEAPYQETSHDHVESP